ncbi:Ankyrin repeat domain-containing protein isoform 3 [Schistosoma japonicum]|uniref:Ankyrin repeat domain-containing protein isoform 3 n=1 Tax=Schistosoma japonicum TaxID=6182 RepID=A0A4Z2CX79_SCHJA|nr:Ankyrin repeat domain-containing protein 45 [Schistosoma japonicum]KAH8861339.1 Ankyrin repeat domain-containing protein 45 [Schistosoma japonicum]TNN08866.1 Ankyrin repeat domain-containing protein isoform 3 [Schistosoma japonicum]
MSRLIEFIHQGENDEIQKFLKQYDKDPSSYLQCMNEFDEMHNSAIELFTMLDCRNIIEKAISSGYNELNKIAINGCNLIHYAAMWNRADLIKYLYFSGVDVYRKNVHGETAHKLANKYEQKEAMQMLEWIECRDEFLMLIRLVREILSTSDKNDYTKEERKIADSACLDGESWINKNKEATLSMLKTKKEQIELIVEPFIRKRSSTM